MSSNGNIFPQFNSKSRKRSSKIYFMNEREVSYDGDLWQNDSHLTLLSSLCLHRIQEAPFFAMNQKETFSEF